MDDFIRLNLNSVISMFSAIFVLFIILLVVLKYIHKEFKKYVVLAFLAIIAVIALVFFLSTVNQASVNNIPRKTIDESYTKQSQQNYEERVTGGK